MTSAVAKILLVDDKPKQLKDALPMFGYEVEVAKDGVQALSLLSNKNADFDLVLLDVMMPNMDGWETLKAIRANKRLEQIPVIMITAVNEEQKQISGFKFGADDYVVKPFILPNLLARIEALLRRSNWRKEAEKSLDISFASEEIQPLTLKEKEILSKVTKGMSNQEIADELCVKDVTVKTHLNNIFKKLKVTNRTQAVLLAMQMKLTDN
ncbi:response regulator transcription factor [bacterium]|nr:response regulator transcription factor [bacterium]